MLIVKQERKTHVCLWSDLTNKTGILYFCLECRAIGKHKMGKEQHVYILEQNYIFCSTLLPKTWKASETSGQTVCCAYRWTDQSSEGSGECSAL